MLTIKLKRLGGKSPISHSIIGHNDAHRARHKQGDNGHKGKFPLFNLSKQDSTRYDTERCDDKSKEIESGQVCEDGLVEDIGNERCTAEKQNVKAATHADVEPKDRVVVEMGGITLVRQGCHKTTIL